MHPKLRKKPVNVSIFGDKIVLIMQGIGMWIRALVFFFFWSIILWAEDLAYLNIWWWRRQKMMMYDEEDWSNKWISINQAIVVAVWLGVIAWNTYTWFYYTQGKTISLFPLSPAFISCWIWHCDEFQQKRRGTKTRLQISDLTSPTNILIALWRDAAAFHAASESWFCRLQRKLLVGLNNAQAKRATAGHGSPESSNQVEKLLLAKPRQVRWSFAWTLRPDIYLKRLSNWLI